MLYPTDIEHKLGFDTIRKLLKEKCLSTLGIRMVERMSFSNDHHRISTRLRQTGEFIKILKTGEAFPSEHYIDVSIALAKAKMEGVFLAEGEFLNINNSLKTILKCVAFLEKHAESYPALHQLTTFSAFDNTICQAIDRKIDEQGHVKDSASDQLGNLRAGIRSKYTQVRRTMNSIFKSAMKEGYVPEGASITVRDGRMVIPLNAEHKRKIKGFVHDESATGQTVFLEPTDVLEGNNEIRELEYAEKREVIKILTLLTDMLREYLEDIERGYRFLSVIDFIRAKARLAIDMSATVPKIDRKPVIDWKAAEHPLLHLTFAKAGKKVVPLTITLQEDQRFVVISGPNAGGKSVCLKTVGLVQYMLQCSVPVPMDGRSQAGIFDDIFIDIGDEQSLENDLSTYSSHLLNMKYFLQYMRSGSLALIDEFGTGTDPQFGGPIAEAILDKIVATHGYGVVTTHYSNIKHYAERKQQVVNGAMKFDMQNLEPLYQLELGKPGSSFSLEIARKIGLDPQVVDYAKAAIGDKSIDVDDLILRLEKQQQEIVEKDNFLKKKEKEVLELQDKYQQLNTVLEARKKEIINDAKKEASGILKQANREIEKTIRHIKENKAEQKETRKMRERLEELKDKVALKAEERKPLKAAPGVIGVRDAVRVIDNDVIGNVLAIKGKDAEIQIGGLKTMIKLNRLEKISHTVAKAKKKINTMTGGIDLNQRLSAFSTTLDVRGKRAEEVIPLVEKFIDDALLFNFDEVRILHGKGDGILREIIRTYLKGSPGIAALKDEHIERGGSGITLVTLK